MRSRRLKGLFFGVAASAAMAAGPAGAEMYRCEGPNGTVTFTGDASACPGAVPHAPSRDLQRLEGDAPPTDTAPDPGGSAEVPAPAARREAGPDEDVQAASWRAKRTEAEAESRAVEHDLEEFEEMVGWCNRGGDLVLEERTGMRRDYSCTEARSEHERLSARAVELRRYLAGGLEEECRREGCLPGWIR